MAQNDIPASAFHDAELDLLLKDLRTWPSRGSAMVGLIKKGKLAVPPLIGLLQDDDPKVRQSAVEALGEIGGDAALTALTIAQYDFDTKVSAEARRASDKIVRLQRVAQKQHADEKMAQAPPMILMPAYQPERKSPAIAALASLIIVGLGHFYIGKWWRGLGFMLLAIILSLGTISFFMIWIF
jgi:hypothetical protein